MTRSARSRPPRRLARSRRAPSRAVRLWRLAILAIVLTAFAAACALINSEERPAPGGSYREAIVGQPRSLNPILDPLDPITQDISRLVHAGLVRVTDGGEITGDLATGWSTSPDGLVYTFQLRPQATWHDGQRVTAADVQATVALLKSPGYAGPPELAALWRGVRTDSPDPSTVRLILDRPYTSFIEACSVAILPAHVFGTDGSADLREHPASYHPIGAGPYRIESLTPDVIALVRHEKYWGTAPYLDRIELRTYRDSGEALHALETGAVDGYAARTPADFGALDLTRFTIREAPLQGQQTILYLNNANPVLADVRVRRAIALTVDRRALVAGPLRDSAVPAYGPVPAYSWAYAAAVEAPPDAAIARRLLDEAGWVGGPVRNRAGRPLQLQLVIPAEDRPIALAESLQRQLEPIGIRVQVQPIETVDFYRERLNPRNYELALLDVWLGSVDPDPFPLWHSSQRERGFNFAGYASPVTDRSIVTARTDGDVARRLAALTAFQTQWNDDAASVVLTNPVLAYALPAAMRGVRLGVVAEPSARFQHIDEWHLKTSRVPGIFR